MTGSPFERTQSEGCLSDFALDRLVGERESHEHLLGCSRCAARHRALEEARDRFSERAPPRVKRRGLDWRPALAVAMAAGLAAVVFLPEDEASFRLKGGPQLSFYVKHGDQVRRGSDGEKLAPNDAIRFAYTNERQSHLAVLSLDPDGLVSIYYPDAGETRLEAPGSDVPLPLSTILDDTLGEERIFALFCEAPIDLEQAKRSIGGGSEPRLEGCQTRSLAFTKER